MDIPDFSKMELDFSDYHPLDHRPWQCGDLPGGWRRHASLAWEFRWEPILRSYTLCLIGLHRMTTATRATGEVTQICIKCFREKPR
jgi:hypothetical protein